TAFSDLPRDTEVWITTTFDTPPRRITPCVTAAVARVARIATRPGPLTAAVLIVHEWGFPHPRREHIVDRARVRGWRVVDDCAFALPYGIALAGDGASVVLSLPKFFPVRTGGLLLNPTASVPSPGAAAPASPGPEEVEGDRIPDSVPEGSPLCPPGRGAGGAG